MQQFELIAPCHFGLESVLKDEIYDLGYEISAVDAADVYFTLHGWFPPVVKGDAVADAYGQYFPGKEE